MQTIFQYIPYAFCFLPICFLHDYINSLFRILRLQESGKIEKLRQKYWPKAGHCTLNQAEASTKATERTLEVNLTFKFQTKTLVNVNHDNRRSKL